MPVLLDATVVTPARPAVELKLSNSVRGDAI
jgi:hypothetical protein